MWNNYNWMWLGGIGGPPALGYIISILIFIGWVLNIVALATAGTAGTAGLAAMTILILLRIIGIFVPPLGAVLGWITVF